jgi:predicted component of type VI protein secretion system
VTNPRAERFSVDGDRNMLPLVIQVEQVDGNVRRYAFAESPVSIGRSPFANLQLSEPFISRWEGTVRFDDREITYFSLRATNSTYLNGKSIDAHEEDIPLGVESVLTLGDLKLRFAREPVPESDLRRKGKHNPMRDDAAVAGKTMYLDRADVWAAAPPAQKKLSGKQPRVLQPRAAPPRLDAETPPAPLGPAASSALRRTYRQARAAYLREVRAELRNVPDNARGPWLQSLQREEPSLFSEPDLHAECVRVGVAPPLEIPELQTWLREISRDVLPANVHFDSRLALTRVLVMVEALVQSLAEVHDAQESVRQRWLGQSPRRSVLQSDKGNLVLAYLLNPQADWSERLQELEETIRDVVTHELALFKAMLEGARALLDAVSPEAIVEAEAAESKDMETELTGGFWSRLFGGGDHNNEARLWQRLLTTYAELRDGDRFERVFLGRGFARSYLAAMGQRDKRSSSN